MIKTLTATATLALLCAPLSLAGTQTVDASGFDQIEARAAMNVIYSPGPAYSVVIETPGDDFSDADISVDGDTLVITRHSIEKRGMFGNKGNLSVSDGGKTVKVNGKKVPAYTVRVTSPDLSGVKVMQSARGEVSGLDASAFKASASSAGKLNLAGRAANATLSASSSGEMEAGAFETGTLNANASSSGELTALTAGTGDVKINASSSGEVSVRSLQAAKFDVSASSGGDVELSGACAEISISASSGGDVEASQLTCEVASAKASSGGQIEAFASVSATGRASSGGDVSFRGNPVQQDADKSSGGSVKFK